MNRMRAAQILTALILGVTAPTIVSLGYFYVTGDPTFRPLGISKAALDTFMPERAAMNVQAVVNWGRGSTLQQSQAEIRRILARSLDTYDVDYRIQINDVAGRKVTVTYVVMGSRLGPYPIARAGRGLGAAVDALRRNQRAAAN